MLPVLFEIAAREMARGNGAMFRLMVRDLLRRRPQRHGTTSAHLDAAMQWLCRAQDATADGGVARSYCVAWSPGFRTVGWLPAYPETTGYIIPTMFDYAARTGKVDFRRRAVAMADWEVRVQMANGAVQGGIIGMAPTPAVFNTGQVIFGWLRAAQETGEERYVRAAERAGRFLVEHQDGDGVWRRGISRYAKPGRQTYNTRTAWSLLELARVTGDRTFRDAGIRNIDSALTRQLSNGWFGENCLDNDDAPLTHTIAYATRGVLEAGLLLNDERYIAAAQRTAAALLRRQRPDGSLAGRYDRHWRPVVRWSCLTGNAQVAGIWLRVAKHLQDTAYLLAAQRAIGFLASVQDLRARDGGVRGGIAGAYPIFGDYGRFEYLNWAAKFFADAVMMENHGALNARPAPVHIGSRREALRG
jgi:hypothetical protein